MSNEETGDEMTRKETDKCNRIVKGKEKIAIIGANDFQNRLILKAKDMGYETHVFAWQCGDVGEKNADYFYPISIIEKEKILNICRKIQPCAVLSIASDLAVVAVNYVAENLGLPSNGIETTKYTTNKYEMRKRLSEFNLPVPQFIDIEVGNNYDETKKLKYPLIVKPTDRSGSRGVTKVFSEEELGYAIENASKYSFEKHVIVEEFLTGEEFSCECISYKGEHKLLSITKKYTTGAPHFIETGHLEPAELDRSIYKKIENILKGTLDALSITTGASHTEIKVDDKGNIGIIEIGARMGGDCIGSDLVYLTTGYDFLNMTIQAACGQKPDLEKKHISQYAGIKFIFDKKDLRQLKKIEREKPKLLYRVQIDSEEEHLVEDSSARLGYFIVVSEEKNDIEQILV